MKKRKQWFPLSHQDSLIAPMVLHQVAAKDEQTERVSSIDRSGPCSIY